MYLIRVLIYCGCANAFIAIHYPGYQVDPLRNGWKELLTSSSFNVTGENWAGASASNNYE